MITDNKFTESLVEIRRRRALIANTSQYKDVKKMLKKLIIENNDFFTLDSINNAFEFLNIQKISEILFVSDLECADKSIYDKIYNTIKENNIKILFFVGDVFTFVNSSNNEIEKLKKALIYFKENKLNISDDFVIKNYLDLQELVSNKNEVNPRITDFYEFMVNCNKLGVPIICYKGNHDSEINKEFIFPNGKKINEYIYFPNDLELIQLGSKIYVTGVNRISQKSDSECKCYYNLFLKPEHKQRLSNLSKLARNTIFLSHHPSTNKFTYLGSYDITMFKERFNFKLHVHGHVKNYNGLYNEKSKNNPDIEYPTISAHYTQDQSEHYYEDKEILNKLDQL